MQTNVHEAGKQTINNPNRLFAIPFDCLSLNPLDLLASLSLHTVVAESPFCGASGVKRRYIPHGNRSHLGRLRQRRRGPERGGPAWRSRRVSEVDEVKDACTRALGTLRHHYLHYVKSNIALAASSRECVCCRADLGVHGVAVVVVVRLVCAPKEMETLIIYLVHWKEEFLICKSKSMTKSSPIPTLASMTFEGGF